ncbi:hypothetical protein AAFF_G00022090 [Aldrovandia affinis]|uniref:Uncharacterized protein n=1 Tax=Aldrovandia affinis TaxID=143900 RepID=A0AAD7S552_9TELE|nr:hypothetical protein AAFF_G00022090 [Aldrovandia affinis]
MHTKTLLVAALIVGSCGVITAEAVPLMCKAVWVIGASCEDVSTALVNQIKSWTGIDGCATGGEKCLYELVSVNQTHIFAKHTNPTDKSVDNLTFILKRHRESPACRTVGISVSAADGKTRDSGTNYCNLWNLVEGSGLTSISLFKEITNDWMCNERSTAKCDIV